MVAVTLSTMKEGRKKGKVGTFSLKYGIKAMNGWMD